jgi:hypothetical protein
VEKAQEKKKKNTWLEATGVRSKRGKAVEEKKRQVGEGSSPGYDALKRAFRV